MSPVPYFNSTILDSNYTEYNITFLDEIGNLTDMNFYNILCNNTLNFNDSYVEEMKDNYEINCSIIDNTHTEGDYVFLEVLFIMLGILFIICCCYCCAQDDCNCVCNSCDCIYNSCDSVCNGFSYCIINPIKNLCAKRRLELFDGSIPKIKINSIKNSDFKLFSTECSICMEEFKGSVRVLSCRHAFHKKCLQPWIKGSIENIKMPECPLCRKPIYTDKEFQKKINIIKPENQVHNVEDVMYYYSSDDDAYDDY